MKFIHKITAVKFRMLLRKYHDVMIAANDAAVSTLCLRHHKKLILSGILLKFHKLILKLCTLRKLKNKHFDQNYPKGPFA